MTLLKHWPLVLTVGWVAIAYWLNREIQQAKKKLVEGEPSSLKREAIRRFANDRAAMVAAAGLFVIVYACVLGPWFMEATFGVTYESSREGFSNLPPAWFRWFDYAAKNDRFAPWIHLFGTDDGGRDLFVRMLEGGRISITVGIVATIGAIVIGPAVGATAGYLGGWVDAGIMRSIDVIYALPYMVLVMVIMSLYGRSIYILIGAIGFTSWLTLARLTRNEVLSIKEMGFVEAAIAAGTSTKKIIFKHIIPNTLGVVIVNATLSVPRVMLEEAFLSFVGFGIRPPRASWGVLLSEGAKDMRYSPWLLIGPACAMIVTLYCLSFVGEGGRKAFDPHAKGFKGRTRKSHTRRLVETALKAVLGNWLERWDSVPNDPTNVLEVGGLKVEFETGEGSVVHAVNDVSFKLKPGECLAIVGESGSGKSVLVRTLISLIQASLVVAGTVLFRKKDILRASGKALREIRGGGIAMVFQDAMRALNPFLTIGYQLREAIKAHTGVKDRKVLDAMCVEALTQVGIPDPEERLKQYQHELSGGMKQRIVIALALVMKPEVIIADEPTTALDVTVQAQILALFGKLKSAGAAIIFITHDVGVVAEVADTVAVMYAGRIVEYGSVRAVLKTPRHPYTEGLLNSYPRLTGKRVALKPIGGDPPDLRNLPKGCAFAARCPHVHDGCLGEIPGPRYFSDPAQTPRHRAHCVRKEEAA